MRQLSLRADLPPFPFKTSLCFPPSVPLSSLQRKPGCLQKLVPLSHPSWAGEPPGAPPCPHGAPKQACASSRQLCSPPDPRSRRPTRQEETSPLQTGVGCAVPRSQLSLHRTGGTGGVGEYEGLQGSCCWATLQLAGSFSAGPLRPFRRGGFWAGSRSVGPSFLGSRNPLSRPAAGPSPCSAPSPLAEAEAE